MKVLFLDVDGCLNGSEPNPGQRGCTIWRECVAHLNRVVQATGCRIVLSSTWRQHVVQPDYMTLKGFGFLLRTHGLGGGTGVVFSQTAPDLSPSADLEHDIEERSRQCRAWVESHRERYRVTAYAAVDDEDHGFIRQGIPFVRTDPRFGLLEADADKLIAALGATADEKAPPVGVLRSACRDCGAQTFRLPDAVLLDPAPSVLGDVIVGMGGEGVRLVGRHLNHARANAVELYRRHAETCVGKPAVELGGEG